MDAVADAITKLTSTPNGWRGSFLGLPLGLYFETRPIHGDGTPPPPLAEEVELLGVVLAGWPQVAEQAEREFAQHTCGDGWRASRRPSRASKSSATTPSATPVPAGGR